MQTPNTPENKAAFMACYWGQEVLGDGTYLHKVSSVLNLKHESFYLELTPLYDISDEDASYIRGIIWKYPGYKMVINTHYVVKNLSTTALPISAVIEIIDYLRSKGYLLPWRDLSVEELIKRGWVKQKVK